MNSGKPCSVRLTEGLGVALGEMHAALGNAFFLTLGATDGDEFIALHSAVFRFRVQNRTDAYAN